MKFPKGGETVTPGSFVLSIYRKFCSYFYFSKPCILVIVSFHCNHYQTETWIVNETCILLHLCYTHSMYARMFDFVNQSMFNRYSWKLCAKLVINLNLCIERILNENDT